MTAEERGAWLDHAAQCPQCHAIAMVMSAPSVPAAARHDRIGRFLITRELGRGAMGVVYAADDPELGRTIAVKVLHETTAADRLRREARALARLDHPNVVRVYDVGLADERAFVAMELVRGENLRKWLASKRELREVLDVLVQAGRGLAAAHEAGIVHRDFKPDNVLVAPGRVVVGDFGLSRLASESAPVEAIALDASSDDKLTRTGMLVGTPAYMAPEQADGDATPASDQFAFCVAAWEACCGARPFAGPTMREIREQAAAGLVLRPVGVTLPRRLERALRRGLAARPEDRFPSMNALIAAIEPRRGRPAIVAGIAVVAVAVVAWTVWPRDTVDACERVGDTIYEAWTPQARERVRAASGDAGVQGIGRYVAAWREARVALCRSTGTAPEELGARAAREACYERARVELARELVDPAATDIRRVIPLAACESGVTLSEAPGTASDPRGCGCPYSPCTHQTSTCIGQCKARAFRLVGPIPGVAVTNHQEAVNGATLDGSRLLYLAGKRCALDHLHIADRTSNSYTSTDLTPQLAARDVRIREGCCTLARDGSGIVVMRKSTPGFMWIPLDGTQLGASDPTPFAQIFDVAPTDSLFMPVLTADARKLYFRVFSTPERNGVYEARRATATEPFGRATKLRGRPETYEYVSGVSDDELTMFMDSEFTTRVVVRETPEAPYGDLAPTIPPSRLPGWRAIPIDGCRRLVTTVTPGGCESEQSVFFEAVDIEPR